MHGRPVDSVDGATVDRFVGQYGGPFARGVTLPSPVHKPTEVGLVAAEVSTRYLFRKVSQRQRIVKSRRHRYRVPLLRIV